MKLRVTKELFPGRISKELPSNFIELGYGLQTDCMQAEMFFNRSFEPFYPYREVNKLWFDLFRDSERYTFDFADVGSREYEQDWSIFDWYHSGYEHNAWFAFPGVGGKMLIGDDSTFLIPDSPTHAVHISNVECDYHGKYAMQVTNDSDVWGGLAQDGKYCRPGVTYRFRGALRQVSGAAQARVEIYREGETSQPAAAAELGMLTGELTVKTAELTVPEEGRYTFALVIPPHSCVLCDDFSLLPDDRISVWKRGAVETGRYVAPQVIRFPGGCFASFYDWHDGIGAKRTPDNSWFWGGYNYNDVGVDELAQYMEALGANAMYCVNVHHPFKRYYEFVPAEQRGADPLDPEIPGTNKHWRQMEKFADLEQGAREARDLVEYCNGGTDTPWGAKRAANGHPAPYGIRYWEMDNETCRWFAPDEYARACVLYSRTMKQVDPGIKIGMDVYTHPLEALPQMLEIAGKDIDFFADRGANMNEKQALIRAYNEANGTDIKYCNTECLFVDAVDSFNLPVGMNGVTKSFVFSKWVYALNVARRMLDWQRRGDIMGFVNFNNLANTHSQSAIETAREGCYVTAAGEMLHQFANTPAAYVLRLEDKAFTDTDDFQVQAAYTEDRTALVVDILNRTETPQALQLDLGVFLQNGTATGHTLYAAEAFAMNTLTEKGIQKKKTVCPVENGVLTYEAEKLSFTELIVNL